MRFAPFLFFYFFLASLFGQHIKFESFTTNEGLSNNSVVDIENDKDGGLWMATWDGLNYFDGHKFVTYKHHINNKNSIPGNYVLDVDRDAKGTIWIFTNEGKVARYLGNQQFQNFQFVGKPANLTISKKGNALVRVGSNYYEFVKGAFVKSANNSIQTEKYQVFRDMLLAKYPSLIINDILKDKTGNIWIATRRDGLYIIPNSSRNLQNAQIDHYVFDLYSPYSFNSNEIVRLHTDIFGNVWLGQKDGGVSMAYQGSELISSVTPHPVIYPHLPSETIRAITKDFSGQVWLGYYTQGLYYYDYPTGCYLQYTFKEQTENPDWNRIRSLFTSSEGSVWVGTYAGLLRINKGKYQLYESKKISNFPNDRNYSVYEDEQNILWIACWGGLAKFNLTTNTFESFKGQELLSTYNFRNVKKVDNELILATETKGVVLLNIVSGKKETITVTDGILGNSVYSVFKDTETNNYWIASLGGLSVYNKKVGVVKNLTEQEGLPSHMVYGLLQNDDQVWLSTTKGLVFVDKKSYKITVINPEEGWQAPEFSEGAYYQDAKGILFFGGVNGLNYFLPSQINIQKTEPKIKIEIEGNEKYSKHIVKKHMDNRLEVNIVPIVFPVGRIEEFSVFYKLEGYDKDWVLLDPNNSNVIYDDIPSGNYQFYIKNKDGEVNELGYFSLYIRKAFYQTVLFYVILLLLLVIALFVIIYIKNKNTLLQKKKLEDQIAERTKVIHNQKEDLLLVNQKLDDKNKEIIIQKEKLLELHNNLKNEDFEIEKFKTFVLSEFQDPISKIIQTSYKVDDETLQKKLVSQSAKLINLVSEWNYLDHIKDIKNQKKSSVNIYPIVKKSIEKVKQALQNNQVNFNASIDKNLGWVEIDLLRFRLLLQYFFNDIIKYSDEKSSVKITISHNQEVLNIKLGSNSTVLKNSWDSIVHFSPYYKAVKVMLKDLEGSLMVVQNNDVELQLSIPMILVDTETKPIETIAWKHLNLEEKLDASKQTILVFSDDENLGAANQILENEQYNLLFETSVSDLSSALQQISIQAIVFYQASFSKELVYFLNQYKQEINNSFRIPIIYISEEINYTLQEQSVELGIDVVIQLPASESFIMKKLTSVMQPKDKVVENKFQQEIFQILTEDQEVETANDKLLKRGLKIIKKELSNPEFNVEMLIELLEVSRVKCYRLFKEVLHQSPSDVITSLRFQKATYLLKNKNLNISEVGFECGFNDPKYFSKSFKKHFGVTPKVYKKENE